MAKTVTINLALNSVTIDFQRQELSVNYSAGRFASQSARLQIGTDFTTAQLQQTQARLEQIFSDWADKQP